MHGATIKKSNDILNATNICRETEGCVNVQFKREKI